MSCFSFLLYCLFLYLFFTFYNINLHVVFVFALCLLSYFENYTDSLTLQSHEQLHNMVSATNICEIFILGLHKGSI